MTKLKIYGLLMILCASFLLALPVRAETTDDVRYEILQKAQKLAPEKKAKLNRVLDKKTKRSRYFKDQLIVKFKKGTNKSKIEKFAMRRDLEIVDQLGKHAYVFRSKKGLERGTEMLALLNDKDANIKKYDEDESIEAMDIDEVREVAIEVQGPRPVKRIKTSATEVYMNDQWYIDNDGVNGLKRDADVNAKEAWELTKGAGVLVAVIDTGFDLAHPDINYYGSGFDVINNKNDASAPLSSEEKHGTAVAGIIAGKDNGYGVTGVAPAAQVIPIRLIADDGQVSISQIIAAHYKAVELGAKIINNSWGSYDPTLPTGSMLELSDLEKEMYEDIALNSHDGKGTLVIFASGNSGASNFYNAPEARLPYTFAVGATDSTDQRVSYSVYGTELDVVAPGGGAQGIYTTDRGDVKIKGKNKVRKYVMGYEKGDYTGTFRGTSAAAPVVAGVAALVWSINPDLSAEEVKTIIKNSANKSIHARYQFNDEGWNREVGYGRVDALKAVEAAL